MWGKSFMQTTGIQRAAVSNSLSVAINYLEDMLNKQDGEAVIETIKSFKQSGDAGANDIKYS
jgi:hypothetical protein